MFSSYRGAYCVPVISQQKRPPMDLGANLMACHARGAPLSREGKWPKFSGVSTPDPRGAIRAAILYLRCGSHRKASRPPSARRTRWLSVIAGHRSHGIIGTWRGNNRGVLLEVGPPVLHCRRFFVGAAARGRLLAPPLGELSATG